MITPEGAQYRVRRRHRPGRPRQWLALHHAVMEDDIAWGSSRNGRLTILDVKDPANRGNRLLRSTSADDEEPLRGRAKVRRTADLFVADDGLIYVTDYDAGLYILQWNGA